MDRHADAARLLLSVRRDPAQPLRSLPQTMTPTTETQAYLIQRAVMSELGEIGGWKVGSPAPGQPCTCAPLPATGIQDSPARVSSRECPLRGVEAEIAVRLGTSLPPQDAPYAEAEVMAAVASAHPAIEVLQSRFADADAVDPLSNLADSMSHGGLVVGPPVADWPGLDLAAERVLLLVDGTEIKSGVGNPAGDMLRLLTWLANEGARWAGGLQAGQVVTTGSWTGKDIVSPGARVRVVFDRAGEAELGFTP